MAEVPPAWVTAIVSTLQAMAIGIAPIVPTAMIVAIAPIVQIAIGVGIVPIARTASTAATVRTGKD